MNDKRLVVATQMRINPDAVAMARIRRPELFAKAAEPKAVRSIRIPYREREVVIDNVVYLLGEGRNTIVPLDRIEQLFYLRSAEAEEVAARYRVYSGDHTRGFRGEDMLSYLSEKRPDVVQAALRRMPTQARGSASQTL